MTIILNQFKKRFNPADKEDIPTWLYDTETKEICRIDPRVIVRA